MIYFKLKGGLGNMMFQIAATYSMASSKGVDFAVYDVDEHLNFLNLEGNFNPTLKHSFDYKDLGFFQKMKISTPSPNVPYYNYPFHYDGKIPVDKDFILDGFFQSEKYFIKHRKELLEFFKPTKKIEEYLTTHYGDVLKQRTTSIHVRRGDYVRLPSHHPPQSVEYYNYGISYLKDKTDIFVVFSDDIQWCKENIITPNTMFIEGEKDYNEIYLMAKCTNHIICNSSFSWWPAWLNNNEDKIVIGPKKWFGHAINHNTGDILAESWIKI